MDKQIIELSEKLIPVITAIAGAWVGSSLSLRNTLKALQIQNDQKLEELARAREEKEKEALRQWFDEFAITGCVEPLLKEILILQKIIVSATFKEAGMKIDETDDALPFEACVRIFTLTGCSGFPTVLNTLRCTQYFGLSETQCQEYNQF